MRDYSSLKGRLRGPVFPVPVPFTADEDVDYASLERYVDLLASHHVPAIMATVGTSRFNLLTREEMMAVNETLVSVTAGRSLTIAAGPGPSSGSTRENIQFAKHAVRVGADAILLVYPERWYSDDAVADFFLTIAGQVDIGVMIHAVPMRDGFGGVKAIKYMDADLIERIAECGNVIGVKEENADRQVYEQILRRHNHRLPIIGAGGAMRRFSGDVRLGAYTYLVGVGSFRPDLALQFYDAVVSGDDGLAESIVVGVEDVYFPVAVELGWHRALKETLHLVHGISPYERRPMERMSIPERERLRNTLIQIGCLSDVEATVPG